MADFPEHERNFPFDVRYDVLIDSEDVITRVHFRDDLTEEQRQEFTKDIEKWADKGIDHGYNGGVMHYLDEEIDWNEQERWVEFAFDLGSAEHEAIEELFDKLTKYPVTIVYVGSGYEDW